MNRTILHKIAIIVFSLLACLYLFLTILSAVLRGTANNPSAEPLDVFMTKGMYTVFIYFFAAGAVSSLLMLFMILLKIKRNGRIWTAAFAVCVFNNLMFYAMIPAQVWLRTKEKLQITLVLLWLTTALAVIAMGILMSVRRGKPARRECDISSGDTHDE